MEIIKVSENANFVRVKLGEIKPNRFRKLDRYPLEQEVLDALKPVSYTHLDVYKRQVQSVGLAEAMAQACSYLGIVDDSKGCLLYTSRCV